MKIAVTGKGGVGKSTIVGMLARALADKGWRVMAIDADPDANLASAIGVPAERLSALLPISKMTGLARERTGATETTGTHFILNPRVDDIPEQFCVDHAGIKLLLMGTVNHAGSGCVCPEHALVRTLLRHILTKRRECVLIDMEAGIEHFGRGTIEAVDLLVIVIEPGSRSLQTAAQIEGLARDLGIKTICHIANKLASPVDVGFILDRADQFDLLGSIPFDSAIQAADQAGVSCYDLSPACRDKAHALMAALLERVGPTQGVS
ncbi:carbon monoxide dehydrogenase [Rhodospirillum rubrum]|uniref:carbon monoxide dehydrogenase accessory protein CooC n=1 Tax=Rhodospirillum rubrum TaxID=1085 RepID=UPI00190645AE|nr:carbon monoxide dehydrogenase accessory protein CooC [Rhodospirillum rubrum]MBK1662901.1 carbon monoxide dehydrogenase [Rhodospirillum rubrum]MBK1677087.1 carbon monoxide dehydrogenase [Rhodospirillum rubrum]